MILRPEPGEKTFFFDGQPVPFRAGETVLEAARRAGIYIPSLCFHRRTGSLSSCRVCVVEIEGRRGLHPSCATAAAETLSVRGATKSVTAARRAVVELLLARGDHDCRTCPADEDCELQDAARHLDITWSSAGRKSPPDVSAPLIVRFSDKCILCGRCVAACGATVVNEVLSLAGRGEETRVICDHDLPMGDSSCVQCGECVQICPTGALVDRRSLAAVPQENERTTVATLCPYCGVGCGISLTVADNRIVSVEGTEGHPVNDGMLCVKGRYGLSFAGSSERLTRPLLRGPDGAFREVSWDFAVDHTARRLKEIISTHGPDSAAGLSSAKCTNEENYLFQKFMRAVVGTNNVDHCARLCHSSTVSAMAASIGSGAMTNSINDIGDADAILVIGSDTTAAHPVIASHIKRAVRRGAAKLIVIDPKKIDLARYADVYVRQRCGTDVALVNGFIHVIIREGLVNSEFVAARCSRFAELAASVESCTPAKVAAVTGVPAGTIERAAILFGSAPRGAVYYAMGITQHTSGTDNVRSLVNLQLLCGNFGRRGTGLNPLRGQCNVQGACDMGALPDVLPGYCHVGDDKGRRLFEKAWEVDLPKDQGLTALEMVDAAGAGALKALYIVGENPCLSDPDISRVRESLSRLDFLAVQDIFMTETAEIANIVLPAASFAEKDGHFTNTERRVQRLRRALRAPGEALEDWEICCRIAVALGASWSYTGAEEINEEMRLLVPSYRGITWDRVGRRGLQWPVPSLRHKGTPILHTKRFPSGVAPLEPLRWIPPAETPDADFPFVLTTGRLLPHFHTGTMTRRVEGLNRIAGPMIALSAEDADILGIDDGETVEVSTRRGKIRAPAAIAPALTSGLIFIPFHFSEAPANLLTNPARDARAKIPEFKVCAARVKKIRPQP